MKINKAIIYAGTDELWSFLQLAYADQLCLIHVNSDVQNLTAANLIKALRPVKDVSADQVLFLTLGTCGLTQNMQSRGYPTMTIDVQSGLDPSTCTLAQITERIDSVLDVAVHIKDYETISDMMINELIAYTDWLIDVTPDAAQASQEPEPEVKTKPAHKVDAPEPVAESVQAPSEPVAESVQAPSEPVAESVQAPSEPVAESVQAPSEPAHKVDAPEPVAESIQAPQEPAPQNTKPFDPIEAALSQAAHVSEEPTHDDFSEILGTAPALRSVPRGHDLDHPVFTEPPAPEPAPVAPEPAPIAPIPEPAPAPPAPEPAPVVSIPEPTPASPAPEPAPAAQTNSLIPEEIRDLEIVQDVGLPFWRNADMPESTSAPQDKEVPAEQVATDTHSADTLAAPPWALPDEVAATKWPAPSAVDMASPPVEPAPAAYPPPSTPPNTQMPPPVEPTSAIQDLPRPPWSEQPSIWESALSTSDGVPMPTATSAPGIVQPQIDSPWDAARRGIMIAIMAPKGGTGKSSTSLYASYFLSQEMRAANKRVVLVDANLQQADIIKYTNQQQSGFSILSIPQNNTTVANVNGGISKPQQWNGMEILFGPPDKQSANPEHLPPSFYKTVTKILCQEYDYVIVDTPVAELWHDYFDGYILDADIMLVAIHPGSIDVDNTIDYLNMLTLPVSSGGKGIPKNQIMVMFNRIKDSELDQTVKYHEMISSHGYAVIGYIPENSDWSQAGEHKMPPKFASDPSDKVGMKNVLGFAWYQVTHDPALAKWSDTSGTMPLHPLLDVESQNHGKRGGKLFGKLKEKIS